MSDVRRKACWKLLGGGVLLAAILGGVFWCERHGHSVLTNPFEAIPLGLLGSYFFLGLIEFVSGVPFAKISGAWDGLRGWQRGVLGLLIVTAAFGVIVGAVSIFFRFYMS